MVTEIRSVLTDHCNFKVSRVIVTISPLRTGSVVNESLCDLGKSDEFLFLLSQAARFNKVACARLAFYEYVKLGEVVPNKNVFLLSHSF